jgi:hypothetical protein
MVFPRNVVDSHLYKVRETAAIQTWQVDHTAYVAVAEEQERGARPGIAVKWLKNPPFIYGQGSIVKNFDWAGGIREIPEFQGDSWGH